MKSLIVFMLTLQTAAAVAQMMPNPYGAPISLENAKKAAIPPRGGGQEQLDGSRGHRGSRWHTGLLREAG